MTAPSRSLAEITERAMDLLFQELGAADAIRFLNQFSPGHGDYTAERETLFAGLTSDQLLQDIKEFQTRRLVARPAR